MEPPRVTKAKFYGSLDQTAVEGHVKNHDGLFKPMRNRWCWIGSQKLKVSIPKMPMFLFFFPWKQTESLNIIKAEWFRVEHDTKTHKSHQNA